MAASPGPAGRPVNPRRADERWQLEDRSTGSMDGVGVARPGGIADVDDRRQARVVADPGLDEDIQRRLDHARSAPHPPATGDPSETPAGGTVAEHPLTGGGFDGLDGGLQVGAELRWRHRRHRLVQIAVDGELVPPPVDLLNEPLPARGDPADAEERRAGAAALQKIEQ